MEEKRGDEGKWQRRRGGEGENGKRETGMEGGNGGLEGEHFDVWSSYFDV